MIDVSGNDEVMVEIYNTVILRRQEEMIGPPRGVEGGWAKLEDIYILHSTTGESFLLAVKK